MVSTKDRTGASMYSESTASAQVRISCSGFCGKRARRSGKEASEPQLVGGAVGPDGLEPMLEEVLDAQLDLVAD